MSSSSDRDDSDQLPTPTRREVEENVLRESAASQSQAADSTPTRDMTPERWRKVQWLFDAVLSRPVEERPHFLDQATADDPSLRLEVDSLIRSLEAASRFIDEPVVDLRAEVDASPLATGTRLGAYRLERQVGAGGVGQVYLATRADEAFEKQVAVKVIKRGMDTDDLIRRFRSERQILAQLDHPNIAKLLDGGATEDGRPYLIMEYVDGTPIDRWCQGEALALRDRIALFLTVCDAVHFAHRNLVVHRDLKPGNILVARDGVPKLLDFGIAKLLDAEAVPGTVVPTAPGWRAMTPEYASPEQVRGEAITTASDVYSLGVVLYEMLTDRRPYALDDRSVAGIERAVCDTDPRLPSRTALAARTGNAEARQLVGDLDDIVMMALEKQPDRRYASVDQLAGDLRRYLDGRPVMARRSTFRYRAGKFVRRNAWAVSAAAAVVAVLLSFVITLVFQRASTIRQRDKAEATVDFLVDLFGVSDPSRQRGETVTAREILERGARDIEAQLRSEPGLQGELLGTMGETFAKLGLYREAEENLERSVALTTGSYRPRDPAIATAKQRLADLRLAQDDHEAAERLTREALAMRDRRLGADAARTIESMLQLAEVRHRRGAFEESDGVFVEATRLARRQAHDALLIRILFRHGVLAYYRDDQAAEGRLQEALTRAEDLWGEDHPEVALILTQLAQVAKAEDADRAAELYDRVLAIQQKVHDDAHPDIASTLNNRAALDFDRGQLETAEAGYQQALRMQRAIYSEPSALEGIVLNNLANVRKARGDVEGAVPLFRASLEVHGAVFGSEHEETANVVNNLTVALQELGRLDEAESLLRGAVNVLVASLGEQHSRVAIAYNNLGRLMQRRGDLEASREHLERAAAILRALPVATIELPSVLQNLASVRARLGDAEGAETLYFEALAALESSGRDESVDAAVISNNLAVAKFEAGDHVAAETWARRTLDLYMRLQEPGSLARLRSRRILGFTILHQGRYDESAAVYQEALDECRPRWGPDHDACTRIERSLEHAETERQNVERQPTQ